MPEHSVGGITLKRLFRTYSIYSVGIIMYHGINNCLLKAFEASNNSCNVLLCKTVYFFVKMPFVLIWNDSMTFETILSQLFLVLSSLMVTMIVV